MHPLYNHIINRVDLSEKEFEQILSLFKQVHLSRKELLIQPGQEVTHQYFVVKGCLRTFMIDHEGKEHTVQFAIENWWCSDYIAYYNSEPSVLYVECIEDCELLEVRKNDLMSNFKGTPKLESFFRLQLESAFVAFQKRILSNLHMTAEARYTSFLKSYPNIEQRVKNYQIASYLGITPESLSRLRKQRTRSD